MLAFQCAGMLCTLLPSSIAFLLRGATALWHRLRPPAEDRFAAVIARSCAR
jgi:hypothetical protein